MSKKKKHFKLIEKRLHGVILDARILHTCLPDLSELFCDIAFTNRLKHDSRQVFNLTIAEMEKFINKIQAVYIT